ncbi:beta strand repeat-containing protein [Herbaspirillum aquaticum]|uniref:Hemolysin D n=1 Tax=Herbaspirillum aquaticum TaxID=568783 RepID=A0A225T1E6_9BURK|nr:calcium-binding protein [Herbaspirillum aquaticum]OWY35892.1 hemolysin D [Herbaspirillum aquaticum]
MPDQAGSFQVSANRAAVQHVQVVDVDMVLHMADGTKVVLAGGAMEAMDDKSKVKFNDISADTGKLLDTVGKISLKPNDQSRVLNSDPVVAPPNVAPAQQVTVDRNSASIGNEGATQFAQIISDNSASLTTSSGTSKSSTSAGAVVGGDTTHTTVGATAAAAQNLVSNTPPVFSPQINPNSNDAPVKPTEPQLPPERPGTKPSTIVVDPSQPSMAIKLVNLATTTQTGDTLYGSGGIPVSATDAGLPLQFSTQVINAPDSVRTIYAAGNNAGTFIKVFDVTITGNGTVLSVTVSGVPAGMTIVNGTDLGGGRFQMTVAAGQTDFPIQFQYSTVEANSASPVHQAFDLSFSTVVATSNGQLTLNDTRHVAVKDATAYGDLSYLDPATGDPVLVLPAQGLPHEIHAGNGGVTVYGSNANDLLYGGSGNDVLIGGTGNTFFQGGAGADQIVGGVNSTGTNVNTASYAGSSAGVTVNLVTGAGTGGDAQGDQLSNIQNLRGSAFDDTFVANAAVNRLDGGSGGSDTVSYTSSNSAVTVNLVTGTGTGGYAQGDTYTHIQNVIGSDYNDVFVASGEANRFDGGLGSNTVSYASSNAGVNVNLQSGVGSGGAAAGDSYVRIQNIIGTAYNDTFVGSADVNSFDGGSGGSDTVSYAGSTAGVSINFVSGRGTGGYAEGDSYNHIQNAIGSAFDDVFIAGVDSVHFDGGSGGSDTVNYGASTGAVTVNMITMSGSGGYAQNNTYTNIQNIVGSSYSDTFIASAAANNFNGGLGGSDTVSYASSNAAVTVDLTHTDGTGTFGGYAQGDVLAHIQNLIGSAYNDTFIASADVNNFNGGGGSNTVSYIFSTGGVTIDLTNAIGTGTGGYYAAGDSFSNIQNLIGSAYDDTFVASADANTFDGAGSNHNRVSYAASTTAVTVDLNYADGTGTSGGYAQGDKLSNIQDLTGGVGNDTFVASAAANNFDGGAGSNRVSYAASNAGVIVDLVLGSGSGGYADNDTYVNIQNVTGSTANDTFIASLAANDFVGGGGTNTVSYAKASDGNGVIVDLFHGTGSNGFAGGDTYSGIQNVIGSAYDDTFIADSNTNVFAGGLGSNTVSYAFSTAAVTVNLVTGSGSGGFAAGDTYTGIQNVVGSSLDDLIIASSEANSIDGGTSTASSHNRVSYASSDAGVTVDLNFTNGNGTSGGYATGDKLANIQDLTGSGFDDTFVASLAANNFDGGGSSHNRVSYASSNAAVTVDLNFTNGTGTSGGYAAGDTLTNIQDLTGSSFDDTFVASNAANRFDGGTSTASSHNRVSYARSDAGVVVDLNSTDGTGTSGGYAAGDTLVNIQDLTGSDFNDTFVASAAANNFEGGGGTNTVSYARANDGVGVTVDLFQHVGSNGFAAGDTYSNIQNVIGSSYADLFIADNNVNSFTGGGGSDTVSYVNSTAAVTVDLAGGTGTGGFAQGDSYSGVPNVIGSSFNDTILASSVANVIDGSGGTHNRVSYASSDTGVTVNLNFTDGTGTSGGYAAGDKLSNIQDLTGSAFDDTFVASSVANNFDGGTGTQHNRVSYASSDAAVTVDLNFTNGNGTSGGYATGDTLTNIQDLTGSIYDDVFVASALGNRFDGGTGSLHNRVSYANSTAGVVVDLNSTDGTGTSGGYAAGDTLVNIQDLTGSDFNDTFVASAAANNFEGGAGTNTVSYARANDGVGVTVDLFQHVGSNGFAAGDTYSNIQNVIGSSYADLFIADNNVNSFTGGGGSDTVSYVNSTAAVTVDLAGGTGTGGFAQGDSYSGIPNVIGSSFNDTILASSVANVIDGSGGTHNRVSYASSNAAVTVDLNFTDGTGTSGGYAAGDKLSNIQDLTGSAFDDTFVASSVANNFDGGTGTQHNRVSYASSNAAVTVDLNFADGSGTSGGYATGDTLTNIQDLTGSIYDDVFVASALGNRFDGGTGSLHNRVSYASSNAAVTVDLNFTDGTGTSGGYAAGDTLVNIQDLTGSNFDDTFIASAAGNALEGGLGSNTVSYARSTSSNTTGVTVDLSAGTGSGNFAQNDTYSNIQNVIGSDFADTLTGFATPGVSSVLTGGKGADSITAVIANRADTYASYAGSTAGVSINLQTGVGTGGDAAGDRLYNIDNLIGSSLSDTFFASVNANKLNGGAGGSDTVNYSLSTSSDGTTGVTVNLSTGAGSGNYAQGDTYVNIENVVGSAFNDTLTGFATSGTQSVLEGGGGADTITAALTNRGATYASYAGSGSAVTIDLQNGTGTGGDAQGDTLVNIDNVIGSAFNDLFKASTQFNKFDGGSGGVDTVSYEYDTGGVTVDLTNTIAAIGAYAAGDTFTNIANLIGGSGNDTFYASSVANSFNGGTGNNTVNYARSGSTPVVVDLFHGTGSGGYAAGDTYVNIQNVTGSAGSDTFYASSAANTFNGGAGGSDTVSYLYSISGDINASLASGSGSSGDASGDIYIGIANLEGSASVNSTLTGNGGANILSARGTATTNVLSGGGASSGTDVFNVVDGGTNTVTVGSGNNLINVSAGSHSAGGAQSDMVNQTTGTSNINSISGGAGVTTLHFADLGSTLNLSNFSSKVTGITTLDVSAGSGTNVIITADDVRQMGMAGTGISKILTVKMSTSESLQIMANGSDHYVYFPGSTDYAFYNASNQEIARIHLVTA